MEPLATSWGCRRDVAEETQGRPALTLTADPKGQDGDGIRVAIAAEPADAKCAADGGLSGDGSRERGGGQTNDRDGSSNRKRSLSKERVGGPDPATSAIGDVSLGYPVISPARSGCASPPPNGPPDYPPC